jgi:membrane protein DedA with SNARE-associated domain
MRKLTERYATIAAMERLGPAAKALMTFGLALRLHHHFHGPPIDYVTLGAAAAASWIGGPGPGESILIAAAVFAAKHKLDIASVLFVAWLGATAGGVGGWLIGMRAGRALRSTRGPLHTMRMHALARGDDVFKRFTVLAVVLTPSWVAGIHHVRAAVYLPVNAASAALWACGIGLGAFYVGPTIVELVDDLGLVTAIALVVLVAAVAGAEIVRRRRHRRQAAAPDG